MTAAPHTTPETSPMPPVEVAPDLASFGAIAGTGAKMRTVRKLHDLLCAIDPRAELLQRELMLTRLAAWVRRGGDVPLDAAGASNDPPPVRRLFFLVTALEAFPALRHRLSRLVQSILAQETARPFFARMGIPGDRGLLAETMDRLARRLLPQPLDEQEITHLVARLFPAKHDADWVARIPPVLTVRFIRVLRSPSDVEEGDSLRPSIHDEHTDTDHTLGAAPEVEHRLSVLPTKRFSVWAPLRVALLDAVLVLASRISAAGLSDAIRARSPAGITGALRESPFFLLPRSIDALLATPRYDLIEIAGWADECRALVAGCREASQKVLERLEQTGVSVDVVYRLELIERSLTRIELLLQVLVPHSDEQLAPRATSLLATLLGERQRDRSLLDIVRSNTRLLARKVVERAGQTGEHYITVTKGDWLKMFLSAAGGGLLTAGTTLLKFLIGWLHRPPLQEGLLAGMNYAGSFMTMQLFGFTLATKQPSMTAAALANTIKPQSHDYSALVTTMARLVRSQLAAAAGNVGMVIPAAYGLDRYWMYRTGHHVLNEEYALKVLGSLHPTQSGTLPFAALTGVILWLSSLWAGWLENWAVYRRLPEAIAQHRIRRIVGQRVTAWASRVFARNISGVGGNISVGFMLGLTPVIGQITGIPLDVRHVTLSTGALTMAMCALGSEGAPPGGLQAAIIGIVCILALNLAVSFAFAIVVALRARDVALRDALRVGWAILVGFFKSPLRFFLPVGEDPSAAKPGHH